MKPAIQFKFEKLVIWQRAMDFGEDINRKYISQEEFDLFYLEAFNLMNMLTAFKKKIK